MYVHMDIQMRKATLKPQKKDARINCTKLGQKSPRMKTTFNEMSVFTYCLTNVYDQSCDIVTDNGLQKPSYFEPTPLRKITKFLSKSKLMCTKKPMNSLNLILSP